MHANDKIKLPPIRLEDLELPPESRPNILKRFWQAITKTPARRFATAVVVGLILSALVLGLMFAMPHLMIGLTMALGSAAIWVLPTAFAAQIAVFTGVVTAAVTLATTLFWGIGELFGLAVAKCKGDAGYRGADYRFSRVNEDLSPNNDLRAPNRENVAPTSTGNPTQDPSDDASSEEEITASTTSEAEKEPVAPEDDVPPSEEPPVPPAPSASDEPSNSAQETVRLSKLTFLPGKDAPSSDTEEVVSESATSAAVPQ